MSRQVLCFLTSILSLVSLIGKAQSKEPKMKYGKISAEEIAMTAYAPDPSAPAVVFFDKGTVTHRYNDNTGFTLEYTRHKRIKIFSKDAYRLANLSLFYFKGQKVTDFKACAYNMEEGKLTESKLGGENVFDEKLTSNYFVKKGAIPSVREGTIIEFKYTVSDDGVGLPVHEWFFQDPVAPTVWSEFEASIPTFIEYKKFSQGWTPFSLAKEELKNERMNISWMDRGGSSVVVTNVARNVNIDYQSNVMHFIQENVPALKPEPFVASVKDYLSQISFDLKVIYKTTVSSNGPSYQLVNAGYKEINQSWQKLGKELLEESYEDAMNSTRFTSADAVNCMNGKSTPLEKATAIYAFIGKNYQAEKYDYFWKTQTMDELTHDRKGSPTDLNLVFINMLRRVKINAYPVLISTRSNGRALSYRISPYEFDRVIAAVALDDSTLTLIDASAWPHPIGLLPVESMNGEGLLLLNKEEISWIPLQTKVTNRSAILADFILSPDGALNGKITFSETGHEAVKARQTVGNKDAQAYIQDRFKDLVEGGKVSETNIEAGTDWNNPVLKGNFMVESDAFSSKSDQKIYLNPMLSFGLKETPFKNPDRKFGVDFGPPSSETLVLTFHIPPGYKVEEAPKSAKLSLIENALSFDYLVDKSNPELLKITIRKNIRTPYISIAHYPDLQQYYSAIVAKMAEQVVLSK